MSDSNVLLLLKQHFRKKVWLYKETLKKYFPELSAYSKQLLITKVLFQNILLFITFSFLLKNIQYVKLQTNKYLFEIFCISLCYIFFRMIRFFKIDINNLYPNFYGDKLIKMYFCLLNIDIIVDILYIVGITMVIFFSNIFLFILFFFIILIFIFILYNIKQKHTKQKILKYSILMLGLVLIIDFIKKFNLIYINISTKDIFFVSFILILVLSWNNFLVKKVPINLRFLFLNKKLYFNALKIDITNIIFLILINLVQINYNIEIKKNILIIILFLITDLLKKTKYIQILSIESFGYFIYYLCKTKILIKEQILNQFQKTGYLIFMPSLIIYLLFMFFYNDVYNFIILFLIYFININIDFIVTTMNKKILHRNELKNLFMYTKQGLSNIIFIGILCSVEISSILKSVNINTIKFYYALIVILIFISITSYIIKNIWKKDCLEL